MIKRSSASSISSLPSIETLLKLCKSETHLNQVHTQIIRKGLDQDQNLISIFISSSSSSSLSYSSSVFNCVTHPRTYLWNHLIKRYSNKFLFFETVSLLVRMMRTGLARPDDYTFPLVMKVCSNNGQVRVGSTVHGLVLRIGFDKDVVVATSVVDFYGKCKDLFSARKVFGEMPVRNVVSWTALIVAYVKSGELEEAKRVFGEMPVRNVVSWTALIVAYVKSGELEEAKRVFDLMSERNLGSWNALNNGLVKSGELVNARRSSISSVPSLETLLKLCKSETHLNQVHTRIIRKGLEQDQNLISIFISSSSSSLSYASSVFNCVPHPCTYLWNLLIKGYSNKFLFFETLSLLVRMMRTGLARPDEYTFPLVMKVCSNNGQVCVGSKVHGLVLRIGFDKDVVVATSLVDFYGKCKDLCSARKVFGEMPVRNVVSWTALVVAYVKAGDMEEAKRMFDLMPERNLGSWNALIDGLVKSGDLVNARKLFDEMPKKDIISYTSMIDGYAKIGDMVSARDLFEKARDLDVRAWSALISGYAQNGQANEAFKVFGEMWAKNVKPDEFIIVGLMSACSQMGCFELCEQVDSYLHQTMKKFSSHYVVPALIDMNAKCGHMDRAAKLFEEMPQRDLVSYCSMMEGMAIHGCRGEAVRLFEKMVDEGIVPDQVAFTVVLKVCSQAKLVEEGLRFFELMQNEYSILPSPDHYSCIVNLLSQTGKLREAYELIKSMPFEAHASAWGSLLGGCSLHGNTEIAEVVARELFELEPQSAGSYVLLSNIYAALDRWADVAHLRDKMKENGIRKVCGRSWVS